MTIAGSSFDSVYSAEEVYADSTSDSTSEGGARPAPPAPTAPPARRKSLDNTGNLQASVSTGDLTYRYDLFLKYVVN